MKTPTDPARIKLLQSMPISGGISEDALVHLMGIAAVETLPPNEYYYHEGDPADYLLVLETGKASMFKTHNSREYPLRVLERGDCFGEVALIDLNPRNTSVRTLEPCGAIRLSADDLFSLYQRDLEQFTIIYMSMARELCRRLRDADQRLFQVDLSS